MRRSPAVDSATARKLGNLGSALLVAGCGAVLPLPSAPVLLGASPPQTSAPRPPQSQLGWNEKGPAPGGTEEKKVERKPEETLGEVSFPTVIDARGNPTPFDPNLFEREKGKGVTVASHHAEVVLQDGFARTEIVEELFNTTDHTLTVQYGFSFPEGARLSRLALGTGNRWEEATQSEEEGRPSSFEEVDSSSPWLTPPWRSFTLGLRQMVVPAIPPHGSRRVLIAYDQVVPVENAPGRARAVASVASSTQQARHFALRFQLPVTDWRPNQGNLVLVVDKSRSFAAEWKRTGTAVETLLSSLPSGKRVALLVCDSGCMSWPERGLTAIDDSARLKVRNWLGLFAPGAASDLQKALLTAARRLRPEGGGEIVYLGNVAPSAGELDLPAIAQVLKPALANSFLWLAPATRSAAALSAALAAAGPSESKVAAELVWTESKEGNPHFEPLLDPLVVELPVGWTRNSSLPKQLRLGDDQLVTGTLPSSVVSEKDGALELTLTGILGNQSVHLALPITLRPQPNPRVQRLWAEQELLKADADPTLPRASILAFARRHQVLSRWTSLKIAGNEVQTWRTVPPSLSPAGSTLDPSEWPRSLEPQGNAARGSGYPRRRHRWQLGDFTLVSGRLPPEPVQRIIRMNQGRFRGCLPGGLLQNPAVSGRVAVRFLIGLDGKVARATEEESTGHLPPQSRACMVAQFKELVFPPPAGGIVTVVYPLVISREGSALPPGNAGYHLRRYLQLDPPAPAPLPRSVRVQAALAEPSDCQRWDHPPQGASGGPVRLGDPFDPKRTQLLQALTAGCRTQALRMGGEYLDQESSSGGAIAFHAALLGALGDSAKAALELANWAGEYPTQRLGQVAAAQAYARAGDGPRSCSHWQASARSVEATGSEEYSAIRCFGLLGDFEAAERELQQAEQLPVAHRDALRRALQLHNPPLPEPAEGDPGLTVSLSLPSSQDPPPFALVFESGAIALSSGPNLDGQQTVTVPDPSTGNYTVVLTTPGTPHRLRIRASLEGNSREQLLNARGSGAVAQVQVSWPRE